MDSYNAREARAHMHDILGAVERGEQVMITRYKTPTAVVVPVPVTGAGAVVTDEYGLIRKNGDVVVWNTAPYTERAYPLATRIEHNRRADGRVWRRQVIVVKDWTEVDGP